MDNERGPVLRWEWAVVLLATIAGAGLRLWFLPKVPGLWYDEAINGLDALRILREPGIPIFFDTFGHMREPMYMYLETLGVLAGGTSAIAIRAVSTVIGIATIPVVWLCARELFGRNTAALALVCFALMRWHIHFSALAFRTILAPLFACLVILFLTRMLRRRSMTDAALCGAFLGLGAYTYLAFRLMPVIVLPPLLLAFWQGWKGGGKTAVAAFGRRLGVLAGTALLVFLPLGINYLLNPEHFRGRGDEVTLLQREEPARLLFRQARDVALMPLIRGDHVEKHNIPGPPRFVQTFETGALETMNRWRLESDAAQMEHRPIYDQHGTGVPVFGVVTGLLFYGGLAVLIFGHHMPLAPRLAVLSWLLIGSLASVLSFGAPNMLRLQILTPAAAITIALAMLGLTRYVAAKWQAWKGTPPPVYILLAIPALLFAEQLRTDAGRLARWAEHPMVPGGFNAEWAEMGDFLREQPDRLPVRMAVDPHPTLVYLADGYTFHARLPQEVERWWELRSEPPFPVLEPSGHPRPDSRRLELWIPAGIRLGVLVEVWSEP